MDVRQGLAAILRDAVLRTASQVDVADCFTRFFADDDNLDLHANAHG
jgi:hypothetical protein